MPPKTINVGTASLRDVKAALRVAGARVTHEEPTPGAVGYTAITIEPAA